jgi:putative transposase
MAPGSVCITCYAQGCGRNAGAINTRRPVVWTAKASRVQRFLGPRGFDAGKLINGRKRHILVDTLGLLLVVVVTVASVQDRDGARLLLRQLPGHCKKLRKIWVDGGYSGRLVAWVAERFKFCLTVVLRPKQTRQFVLLPRRWVVERTFGWLNHSRRLSKSYERLTRTDETWVYIAMTRIMLNRLA